MNWAGWRSNWAATGNWCRARPGLTVESAIVIPEAPAHLVPLPPGNPGTDT